MRPALTPEEWDLQTHDYAQVGRPPLPSSMVTEYAVELVIRNRPTTALQRNHAMAAMCLYGQPFGLTWEDVDLLRGLATWVPSEWRDAQGQERMHDLADRIAALLPPRETKPEP